jgi:hypothetical protein
MGAQNDIRNTIQQKYERELLSMSRTDVEAQAAVSHPDHVMARRG